MMGETMQVDAVENETLSLNVCQSVNQLTPASTNHSDNSHPVRSNFFTLPNI